MHGISIKTGTHKNLFVVNLHNQKLCNPKYLAFWPMALTGFVFKSWLL